MEWFQQWWYSLGLAGQIMAGVAIPASVFMILQMVLMLVGASFGEDADSDADSGGDIDGDGSLDVDGDGGLDIDTGIDVDGGFDVDVDGDLDIDGDGTPVNDGFILAPDADTGGSHSDTSHIFTVRGIVAFFALGGWAGLASLTAGIPTLWSIQIALITGAAAMLLASYVIKFALKMQSSGNINLKNAVSQIAEVYITIPPSRTNTGKVTMELQERFVELEAVTDSETEIKTGAKVVVTGLAGPDCLVVRHVEEDAPDDENS